MQYQEAFSRLLDHANLGSVEEDGPPYSTFLVLLYIFESEGERFDCQQVANGIIDCLQVINHHFNGPTPSAGDGQRKKALPRDLAYAMTKLLQQAWEIGSGLIGSKDEAFRREIALACMRIGWAWEAVLAGEFDSMHEHVEMCVVTRL